MFNIFLFIKKCYELYIWISKANFVAQPNYNTMNFKYYYTNEYIFYYTYWYLQTSDTVCTYILEIRLL